MLRPTLLFSYTRRIFAKTVFLFSLFFVLLILYNAILFDFQFHKKKSSGNKLSGNGFTLFVEGSRNASYSKYIVSDSARDLHHKILKSTEKSSYDQETERKPRTELLTLPSTTVTTTEEISKRCEIKNHRNFPLCEENIKHWLKDWKSLKCFTDVYNLDGSKCSLIKYFQEIEPYCAGDKPRRKGKREDAIPRFDLAGVLEHVPGPMFEWMRNRTTLMWNEWVNAGKNFIKKKQTWKKKKALLFMGSMSFQHHFMTNAGKGGPLGELVQWTDLICSMYILGYDIRVALNVSDLNYLDKNDGLGCASKTYNDVVDVIYTDLNGAWIISQHRGGGTAVRYRCMYRILDSFGTFPEFNYPSYPHKIPGGRSGWGNTNLLLPQFLTLYPHTQDNNFLGFVVGKNTKERKPYAKKNQALLYAKHSSYFNNKLYKQYLEIIKDYFEIHATAVVSNGEKLQPFIINHGPVSGKKVQELLRESKLFIGVGFPFEGPGPMEAMAAGSVFLQPKFANPETKRNGGFFGSKPTGRKLYSQAPYMEEFVGEPYCFTIDINNQTLLKNTLQKIKDMESLPPKIPKEFTYEGELERIHVFTEHMDFCDPTAPRWPPLDNMQIFISSQNQSCKDTCMSKGLVCERSYFDEINNKEIIERSSNIECTSITTMKHLHQPSYDPITNQCYLQDHGQLFSCSHDESNVNRICPCRDYEIGQVSLCKNCLK